jgi:hypothetical protein
MATPPDFTAGQILTAAQMNRVGLWLIETQTTTGGTVSFNNVFTSDYRNYKIIITTTANTSTADITARMRVGGVDTVGSNYSTGGYRGIWTTSGAVSAVYELDTGAFHVGRLDSAGTLGTSTIELFNPQNAQITSFSSHFMDALILGNRIGRLNNTTQYDGITLLLTATWAGTISIYGYNN